MLKPRCPLAALLRLTRGPHDRPQRRCWRSLGPTSRDLGTHLNSSNNNSGTNKSIIKHKWPVLVECGVRLLCGRYITLINTSYVALSGENLPQSSVYQKQCLFIIWKPTWCNSFLHNTYTYPSVRPLNF